MNTGYSISSVYHRLLGHYWGKHNKIHPKLLTSETKAQHSYQYCKEIIKPVMQDCAEIPNSATHIAPQTPGDPGLTSQSLGKLMIKAVINESFPLM